MFLLVILAGTMMLGLVMLVGSLAAGAVNLLFGRPAGPSRLATKQMEIQELLEWAEELQQQARQLQKDQAEWMDGAADRELEYWKAKTQRPLYQASKKPNLPG